jgi:ankyrin repeat protein
MIKTLIDLGADPNLADGSGTTALVAAAMRDHVPSIKMLLENGAKVDEPGPDGVHPLTLALADSRYEVAKALIEGGADVSVASGPDGLTPLMVVSAQAAPAEGARFVPGSARPTDIAKAIVDRGGAINAQAKNGMTALMVAAAHNNAPMIGLLMDAGADATLKNAQGLTATDVAEKNGNLEAAQAILVLGSARAAAAPAQAGGGAETTSE